MSLANYQFNYSLMNNPNKPVILFLHGFMGNIDEFDEAITLLSDEFSYLTIDLPGHGKTQILGSDECYTMANTAEALINLLDELQIDTCFLVGYSMGGRLALYLTLHFPERFSQVILESASPGLATEAERLARIQQDYQIGRKLIRTLEISDFADFLSNWYSQPIFGDIKNHPKYELMLENRLQNYPLKLDKSLRYMGTGYQPSLWDKLKESNNPLLLMVGEYDEKFIDINQEMAEICQTAQLKVIKNSGHNIHFGNTKEFVENLRSFFD
jgi:2-succinyl-6-hydroxy-2,4-cyclohexadiene-1-carboxylate synthase